MIDVSSNSIHKSKALSHVTAISSDLIALGECQKKMIHDDKRKQWQKGESLERSQSARSSNT